jgi:hypothetical protein
MPMPILDETSRLRPLCYDPSRRKFILFDDIVSRKEAIIPVESLSERDFRKLVIKRLRVLSEHTMTQEMKGAAQSPDEVIRAIERNEPFGLRTLEAERVYLHEFLDEIRRNLK